mgnify:CR=1 FL=1
MRFFMDPIASPQPFAVTTTLVSVSVSLDLQVIIVLMNFVDVAYVEWL